MEKINYTFKNIEPLHTGALDKAGTLKLFRKEKINVDHVFKSKFKTKNERTEQLILILIELFNTIDKSSMQKMRLLKIWDEFNNKLLASSRVRTKEHFINEFCRSFNIESLKSSTLITACNYFSDSEFLNCIRNERQFLIILIREIKDIFNQNNKEKKIKASNVSEILKDIAGEDSELEHTSSIEYAPFISGNSIRGKLRRLVMYDFFELLDLKNVEKSTYHMLFTGGSLSGATSFEDIGKREEMIRKCPMLGLFGSAIGNQTIEGMLKVSHARPKCKEHATGTTSFWEVLGIEFGTRLDTSKTEAVLTIDDSENEKNQMLYEYEVIIPYTEFEHTFICNTDNKLLSQAFHRMLELFKLNSCAGGMSAVGNGHIDLCNLNFDAEKSIKYRKYIQTYAREIKEFLLKTKGL